LYVVTDLRELRADRRPSLGGMPRAVSGVSGASSGARGMEAVPKDSASCSTFVASESTLYSSSRLVGGVEMEGDALDMARTSTCFSVCTVMLDSVEDVDVGEASRAAMARALRERLARCDGRVGATQRRGLGRGSRGRANAVTVSPERCNGANEECGECATDWGRRRRAVG
jgi:hypothetical protein